MNPKVTIVVPVLNVARYIRECMESILNQTMQEIEVFVIDAHSTDGTYEILEEYVAKDKRVQILEDRIGSTGYAKNLGIDKATASYIIFVESDDYIEPDMVEQLYDRAEETGADIVKGGFDTFVGSGKEMFVFPKTVAQDAEDYERVLMPREHIRCFRWIMFEWLGIYRKSFLDKYHIRHNETLGAAYQDIGFWFVGFSYASKVYLIKNVFYHYRCDNPNASVKSRDKMFQTCGEYAYIYESLRDREEIWKKVYPAFCREFFRSNEMVYNRLKEELKPVLSDKMREILFRAKEERVLDESLFKREEKKKLKWLMDSARIFDRRCHRIQKRRSVLLKNLKEKCSIAPSIVIFCAGSYGANLHYILKKENVLVSAYADNNSLRWDCTQNGLKIYSVEKCETIFPHSIYLIANEDLGEEIAQGLRDKGIEDRRIEICDVPLLAENLI